MGTSRDWVSIDPQSLSGVLDPGGNSVIGLNFNTDNTGNDVRLEALLEITGDGRNAKADIPVSLTVGNPAEVAPALPSVPERFTVNAPYPNPFNSVSIIPVAVAKEGMVTVAVYDLNGRNVASLVHNRLAAGTYEFPFDAGTLSSGIYIVRAEQSGIVVSRKLALVR